MVYQINNKKYVLVVDEGFASSWRDQVLELLPLDEYEDKISGPIYIYSVDDVTTVVSLEPLTLDEMKAITTISDSDEEEDMTAHNQAMYDHACGYVD
jgi:hypothetical protein